MNEYKHLIATLSMPRNSELSVRLNSHNYCVKVTDDFKYQVTKDDETTTTTDKIIAVMTLKYYLKEN